MTDPDENDGEDIEEVDEFDLRPDEQKRDYNRINASIWVRNMMNTFQLFAMIFGCAFFFGMMFRTVITFSIIGTDEARAQMKGERLLQKAER
jgi:hypothetical protein